MIADAWVCKDEDWDWDVLTTDAWVCKDEDRNEDALTTDPQTESDL